MIVVVGTIWFALNLSPGYSRSTATPANLSSDTTADTTGGAGATMSGSGFSFEVFGRVQGVFFRKYTERKANELGLAGWVRNTSRGSVEGEIASRSTSSISSRHQGESETELQQMKRWLGTVGSPKSTIDRADFAPLSEERVRELQEEYATFRVRKTKR